MATEIVRELVGNHFVTKVGTGGAPDELTADELAAIQGAAAPDAGNVFATMADVGGGTPDLAAVLAEGADADGTGIENLGETTLSGAIVTNGELISAGDPSSSPVPANLFLDTGGGGEADLWGADNSAAGAGGRASINGGFGDGGNTNGAYVRAAGGGAADAGDVFIRTGNNTGDSGFVFGNVAGACRWVTLGGIKLNTLSAPADGDLEAGELRFWFDQTDGAAKLMMKAKQADGTVKTGAVNVQT